MLRAYKIEIKPTKEQIEKINKTIGVCRFIYNFYIAHNKENYKNSGKFISGMEFSKWLNNDFIPNNKNYYWIKEVSSKAIKQSIMNGENVGIYLPKNNKTDFTLERHRLKIPTLGFVRLKEYGYIPLNSIIKSGTITKNCNRYYISILVEEEIENKNITNFTEGIGIDLGLKDFAVISTGETFKNINKTKKIKDLKKSLKRQQRKLSRKYEGFKNRNKQKGGNATRQNIDKQILKVQKLHNKLTNIRTDYINKIINELVKTKPKFINMEDLNISGIMKNRHLSRAISEQKFYEFRTKLINKCHQNNIEVRLSNRFYASSKTCSCCGSIKKDLKLSDRIYKCTQCGTIIDRDLNASINLRDNQIYKIA